MQTLVLIISKQRGRSFARMAAFNAASARTSGTAEEAFDGFEGLNCGGEEPGRGIGLSAYRTKT